MNQVQSGCLSRHFRALLYQPNVRVIIVTQLFVLVFRLTLSSRVSAFLMYVHSTPPCSNCEFKVLFHQMFHLNSFSEKPDLNWLVSFKVKLTHFDGGDIFMYLICSMLLQILLRTLYNIKGIYLITFPEVQHILHAKSYLVLRISTETLWSCILNSSLKTNAQNGWCSVKFSNNQICLCLSAPLNS